MRKWLKELRTKNEMTQEKLAVKLGIAQSYYNMIETGERQKNLELDMAQKFSEIFNVPLSYIVEQEQDLNKLKQKGDKL